MATSRPAADATAAAAKRASAAPDTRPISVRHSTSSHRHSRLPAAPLPPLSMNPNALPADNATITGTHPVSVAADCVVHPYARLDASQAPIVLDEAVIIWERAWIGVKAGDVARQSSGDGGDDEASDADNAGVRLEQYVVVGNGAVVEARDIGQGTVIETGARIGKGCVIGKYCRIAPNVHVPDNTTLPDFTVVVASSTSPSSPTAGGLRTRTNTTLRDNERVRQLQARGHDKQVALMRKLLKVNMAKWTAQI